MGYFSQYVAWVREEVSEGSAPHLVYPPQWTSYGALWGYRRPLELDANSQTCHLHSCSQNRSCSPDFYPQPFCETQVWARLTIAFLEHPIYSLPLCLSMDRSLTLLV